LFGGAARRVERGFGFIVNLLVFVKLTASAPTIVSWLL
jgi:hypothetical protein